MPDWYDKLSPYQKYLRSDHWIRLRARKIEDAGGSCNRCGSRENIEVHHLYYAKSWWDCQLADLEVLCEKCHRKAHKKKTFKPGKPARQRYVEAFRNPYRQSFTRNVCGRY